MVDPAEIAHAVFLLENDFVAGETFNLNGWRCTG